MYWDFYYQLDKPANHQIMSQSWDIGFKWDQYFTYKQNQSVQMFENVQRNPCRLLPWKIPCLKRLWCFCDRIMSFAGSQNRGDDQLWHPATSKPWASEGAGKIYGKERDNGMGQILDWERVQRYNKICKYLTRLFVIWKIVYAYFVVYI